MSQDPAGSIVPYAIVGVGEEEEERAPKYLKRAGDSLAYESQGEWLNGMKGSLSLAASIIATLTLHLAIHPPGGVVQPSASDDFKCSNRTGGCPGEAVWGIVDPGHYYAFLVSNTICFIASITVCLLLVSGITLKHRLPIWLVSIGMGIAITSLALTYTFAVSMVHPRFRVG